MRILLDENMPPSSAIIFPSLMSAPRNSWAGRGRHNGELVRLGRVQHFAVFCCIRPTPSYLRPLLKPDNLGPICNNISERVLQRVNGGNMTTTAVARRRRPRGLHPKRTTQELQVKKLPEYLEAGEVNAIIRAADDPRARLLMLEQWRAGLRVLGGPGARSRGSFTRNRAADAQGAIRQG